MLKQYAQHGPHQNVMKLFAEELDKHGLLKPGADLLTEMKKVGLISAYKHQVLSHLVLGLMSDLLHFLHEGLRCMEKRKFVVALSNFRKPLKDNMLFLSWILGDEDEFLEKFETNTCENLKGTKEHDRLAIFEKAIAVLPIPGPFNPEVLHDLIFSKTSAEGLEPDWQRAMHLITSQGASLKTEDFNLNWLFHNPTDDELFEIVYPKLGYLMLYLLQIALGCFEKICPVSQTTTSHMLCSSFGIGECLMPDLLAGLELTKQLGSVLAPMLDCVHCGEPIQLTAENAPAAYVHEHVDCVSCGLATPFPLYFLLAKAGFTLEHANAPKSAYTKLFKAAPEEQEVTEKP